MHAVEIQGRGWIFGQSAITGFQASGATHDVIQFSLSMFSNLNSTMTQAQDVSTLLSGAAQVGANVQITDATGDLLTLNAITKSTLSAHPGAFRFV